MSRKKPEGEDRKGMTAMDPSIFFISKRSHSLFLIFSVDCSIIRSVYGSCLIHGFIVAISSIFLGMI